MKAVAVIPSYNEATTVGLVAQEVQKYVDMVVVVDDGSKDTTQATLQELAKTSHKIVALHHEINLGKGAALKTGCDAAIALGADYIVCLDADHQHTPNSIPQFIQALQNNNDVVFGIRQLNSRMPLILLLGNKFLSIVVNALFHVLIHDTQSGFRAFTSQAYNKLRWKSTGYEVETEMIVRMSQHELKYSEVDIDTIYHDGYKGTTALDGIKIFGQIVKWKLL